MVESTTRGARERDLHCPAQSNHSIADWIEHEGHRRRLNIYFVSLAVITCFAAVVISPGTLLALPLIALFAGMANVSMALGAPELHGTDEQFRAAAVSGPKWFRRLLTKMDSQGDIHE